MLIPQLPASLSVTVSQNPNQIMLLLLHAEIKGLNLTMHQNLTRQVLKMRVFQTYRLKTKICLSFHLSIRCRIYQIRQL